MRQHNEKISRGFTLLEVLVAVSIVGIAIVIILQLFSSNLRTISASEDYSNAMLVAEAKMRELLAQEELLPMSLSETSKDGYSFNISIIREKEERTENINAELLRINLTISYRSGLRERKIVLTSLKTIPKKI